MPYYYWDSNFVNNQGETLEQCANKYGIGKQNLSKKIIMEVIFLNESKDFGYSWCLRSYNKATNNNIPVKLYENNKVEGVYTL